jgi:hypothetical protein
MMLFERIAAFWGLEKCCPPAAGKGSSSRDRVLAAYQGHARRRSRGVPLEDATVIIGVLDDAISTTLRTSSCRHVQ